MLRQGTRAYRNVVAGLVLPVTLAGCFMHEPVDPADLSNAPPPTGNNNAPEIWGNAPRVVKVGVDYSFTPEAMDPDGDPLSFSINNEPTWLTFDSSNGRISGVPLLGNEGTYNDIEIAVSDGQMSTNLPRFSISVEPNTAPNMPPEIDGTPATSVTIGDTYTFTPTSSDPDGDPLTYSIQNRPGWASFSSATGQLSGTPQPGDAGTYTDIAITVSDSVSTASLPAFSITVIAANSLETIVDNLDTNTAQSGIWTTSNGASPYMGNSVYCNSGCTFTWQPNLPGIGTYEVYAYWTYHNDRSARVPYRIDHDGGAANVLVNQHDTTLASQWNLLGIYNLTAGANGAVTISSENGQASADAVRYVLINEGLSDTVPPTDPTGLSAATISGSQIDLTWAASTDDVYVAGYFVYQNGDHTAPVATVTISSYSVTGLTLNTSYTFEVAAFDPAGNESGLSNVAAATTGAANSAPQISGTPSPSVNVGQSYSFTPTASDPDGDTLTFSIQNMPPWASFSTVTGELSGTTQTGDIGIHGAIVISVSDGTLSSSLPAFSISVVEDAPTCTDSVNFLTVTTSSFGTQDADSDFTILNGGASIRLDNNTWRQTDTIYTITPNTIIEFTFESSVQGEVHGIGFVEDNALYENRIFRVYGGQNWVLSDFNTYAGPGPETFTIPVGQYYTGSGFRLVIANDDDAGVGSNGTFSDICVFEGVLTPMPPVINDPGDQSSGINTSVLLTVMATDANGDTLTFSATGLPNGLSIAPDGTISGIPTTLGTWSVTVTADDGVSGSDSATFNWTITTNSQPQISGTPSTIVNVGQTYSFLPTASDPDGDNLIFSIQNLPGWAQFDAASGALSGTPQVGDAGSYANISISVSDGNLSDTLPEFTITVNQVSLGSATLSWTPPTQNTDGSGLMNLAGFKIYYGTSPDNYPNQITINNPGITTYVVDNLTPNIWYFVSTAFNSSGMESDFSNVATKTIN
ncbi:MAG: putative Ig domain-containing protein [Proteobacteria bacterium]|nr:putative Ig domain-containing protein [Pseudomonadota bacterium]